MPMTSRIARLSVAVAAGLSLLGPLSARAAADWSELLIQDYAGNGFKEYSKSIDQQTGLPNGQSTSMNVVQLTYSNGWKYGATFFYVDTDFDHGDVRLYTQAWEYFSIDKIIGKDLSFGPVKEIRFAPGWSIATLKDYYAGDQNQGTAPSIGARVTYPAADEKDLFLGFDFPLDIPGFEFAGLTVGVYKDLQTRTKYTLQRSADFYYRTTWYWGPTRWKAQGFAQVYSARTSRANSNYDATHYLYSQNAVLLDTGLLLWERPNQFFAGVQYQYSKNAYGVKTIPFVSQAANESFLQLMVEFPF